MSIMGGADADLRLSPPPVLTVFHLDHFLVQQLLAGGGWGGGVIRAFSYVMYRVRSVARRWLRPMTISCLFVS